MSVTASRVFEFLQGLDAVIVERQEINSAAFGALRRSTRHIVLRLHDSEDQEGQEISGQLRTLLSEWLTVPVPFTGDTFDAFSVVLGDVRAVGARWGADIQALYESALRAVEQLSGEESPMRTQVRAAIGIAEQQGRPFKIFCHRQSRRHFESLRDSNGGIPSAADVFLHSVRDYRDVSPFDVLIKVGPLRAHGWGAVPDALRTAPRFRVLSQLVWGGCNDDADFGYDPASLVRTTIGPPPLQAVVRAGNHNRLAWTVRVTRHGDDSTTATERLPEEDELRFFREIISRHQGRRRAALVQIDDQHGVLYPPHARVLSFDPDPSAVEPVSGRIPGDTLREGMFVILPNVGDIDLGELHAQHGDYSQRWKTRLSDELAANAGDLVRRLRLAGLNLLNLRSAMRHWCKPPSTVIHAPQQMKHFEILMHTLSIAESGAAARPPGQGAFWKSAWTEIRRSRGEAIQAGFQEQEIVEEQLVVICGKLMPAIRDNAAKRLDFRIQIPADSGVAGQLLFFMVCGIEEGLSAPETEFRVVRELTATDQWRD